jgi:hypothetical protein
MEGSMLSGQAWWPMEGEGKTHFQLFHFPPQQTLLKPLIFSFDLTILLLPWF